MKRALILTERETGERTVTPPPLVNRVTQRLTPDLLDQLVADYQSGLPTTELMTRYKLGKGTVLSVLERAGVQMRGQGLTDADLPRVVELYTGGWSLKRLGADFACDAETVRQALLRSGVRLRKPWERPGQTSPT